RVACRVVGDHHGNAGDDRKSTALAPEHARFDASAGTHERLVVDERQAGATERAAQQVEHAFVHGGWGQTRGLTPGLPSAANRSMNASTCESTADRRYCSI